jgi:hypothetical protein
MRGWRPGRNFWIALGLLAANALAWLSAPAWYLDKRPGVPFSHYYWVMFSQPGSNAPRYGGGQLQTSILLV